MITVQRMAAALKCKFNGINQSLWLAALLSLFLGLVSETRAQQPMPPGLPQIDVKVTGQVGSGNIFMNPRLLGQFDGFGNMSMMCDSVGNLLWYYVYTDAAGNQIPQRIRDFKVFWDGTMVMGFWQNFFTGHVYLLMDTGFNITDTILCAPYELDNHDIIKSLDGHYHLTCFVDSIMDASILTNTQGQTGSTQADVVGLLIRELDENLNTVSEWNSLEYLPLADMDESWFNTDSDFVDFTHTNAIAFDLDSNYIVSNRNMNEITKVNASTGAVMWRLGGKASTFTFPNDTNPFTGQHDCRILPNGNITIYDNAARSNPAIARGVEYALDTVANTATLVFSYENPWGLPAGFIGSMQRQANGNSLIGWGGILPPSVSRTAYEVTGNGDLVMDLDVEGAISYRVKRFEMPFQYTQPPVTYNPFTFMLSTDPASEYIWTTGATTQSIQVDEAGAYKVFVPYGDGYMGSNQFDVPDIFDSLWTTNVTDESATLNWTAIAGAVAYNVRYRSDAGGAFASASTSGTSVAVAGLSPGTTYEWQVQAVFGATNSLYSFSESFTTVSFGPPVPIFHTINGFGSVTLNWTANADATDYFVRGKLLGASDFIYLVVPGGTSSIDLTLPDGLTYTWQIASIFESGISNFSNTDTFTTPICNAPTPFATTNITSTSATVNWTPTATASSYLLGGRPVGSTGFITIPISNPAQSFYVASGLTPGTSYEWTIASLCAGGRNSGVPGLATFTTLNGPVEKGEASTFDVPNEGMALYPNPAKNLLTISVGNDMAGSGYQVSIIDLSGRVVLHASNHMNPLFSLDIADVPNGIYMVTIQSESSVHTKKLIVAR